MENLSSSKVSWPRWTWHGSEWWFATLGTLFSLLIFVYPGLSGHRLGPRIAIAVLAFVLAPLLALTIIHLFKTCGVLRSRMASYNHLHQVIGDKDRLLESRSQELSDIIEQKDRQIAQAQAIILELWEIAGIRKVEIEKTVLYNGQLYVVLRKRRGLRLVVSHKVTVLDINTGGVMGIFEVTEERGNEYWAKSSGVVDAVWLGFVQQSGNTQAPPPPETVAFYVPREVDDNEQ